MGEVGSTSDHELLEEYCRSQSQPAFAELLHRHLNLVYYTALRQVNGDAPLAEEVAQNVFLALAAKAAVAQRRPVLAAWLYQSTRLAAAQAVRTESRRRRREGIAANMNVPLDESPPAWAHRGPELDEALAALSAADQELVLQRFFSGCSLAEIGVRRSISADAARMRVDRALDKLRQQLARRGIVSTAGAIAAGCLAQAQQTVPVGLVASTLSRVASGVPTAAAGGMSLASAIGSIGWAWVAAVSGLAVGSAVIWHRHLEPPTQLPSLPAVLQDTSPLPLPATSQFPGRAAPAATLRASQLLPRVQRLNDLVQLSPTQQLQATAIFTHENQLISQLTAGPDRVSRGSPIREDTRKQIRRILNEGQRSIYDQTPQAEGGSSTAPLPTETSPTEAELGLSESLLETALRASPAVLNQLGEVINLRRVGSRRKTVRRSNTATVLGYMGAIRYEVEGPEVIRQFEVDWERIPSDAPVKITGVKPLTP